MRVYLTLKKNGRKVTETELETLITNLTIDKINRNLDALRNLVIGSEKPQIKDNYKLDHEKERLVLTNVSNPLQIYSDILNRGYSITSSRIMDDFPSSIKGYEEAAT